MRHGRELGLDASQRKAITKAVAETQAKALELQWDLQEAAQTLAELVSAGSGRRAGGGRGRRTRDGDRGTGGNANTLGPADPDQEPARAGAAGATSKPARIAGRRLIAPSTAASICATLRADEEPMERRRRPRLRRRRARVARLPPRDSARRRRRSRDARRRGNTSAKGVALDVLRRRAARALREGQWLGPSRRSRPRVFPAPAARGDGATRRAAHALGSGHDARRCGASCSTRARPSAVRRDDPPRDPARALRRSHPTPRRPSSRSRTIRGGEAIMAELYPGLPRAAPT